MKTIEELKALIQAGKDAEMELEERGRVKFREGEMAVWPGNVIDWHKNGVSYSGQPRKLTLEELVLSMAPPEAVRWEMRNNIRVYFFDSDGEGFDSITFPDHMARDDWRSCGGPL